MQAGQAQRIIEALRKGIPPDGYVRHFTVGRKAEIQALLQYLDQDAGIALLLNANYGSGKTHLLRFTREEALSRNYAVSTVTLDAGSAVRFNRMDQMFGAVCRNFEQPCAAGEKGIHTLFRLVDESIRKSAGGDAFWTQLTGSRKWDYSEALGCGALYVALRAWLAGALPVQKLAENGQLKQLVVELSLKYRLTKKSLTGLK